MDWTYKAVLTAMTVAAVLMAAQLFGRRVAGVVAGLPVITVPALLWIATEQGSAFAAASVRGIFAACAMAAVFAVVYERTARTRGPVMSLLRSLAAAAAILFVLQWFADHSWMTFVAAMAVCVAALQTTPTVATPGRPPRRLRGELVYTAALAGLISAAVSLSAPQLGPFWCGVCAALPVISGCALVHQHLTATATDRQHFVRGYAAGLLSKLVFAALFGLLATELGALAAVGAAALLAVPISIAGPRLWTLATARAVPIAAPRH